MEKLAHSMTRNLAVMHRCLAVGMLLVAGFCSAAEPLPMRELAPGVFVHVGLHAGATPENHGAIANIGFVIGTRCVAVIDSGGSFVEGDALRAAIKIRTATPICYVINTHVHPDHVYGNAAFMIDKPNFVGHSTLAAAMGARRDYYSKYLERTIGPVLAAKSSLVPPDIAVTQEQTLDLGGRMLLLRAWPIAHTNNDLSVFDPLTGTLWLGDLLFRERIPVVDGSIIGWLATMTALQGFQAARVIPGHGEPTSDWPAAMAPQQRYLSVVRDGVRAALKAGKSITDAVREVGASERGKWQLFDDFHAQNVTAVFTELEWED